MAVDRELDRARARYRAAQAAAQANPCPDTFQALRDAFTGFWAALLSSLDACTRAD